MRQHKFSGLLAASLASLALLGCGGHDPDYGTRPQAEAPFVPGAGIAPPRFAYVVNSITNNVSGYTVNAATGALTLITSSVSNSPWATGTTPTSMSVDTGVQFAYVVNSGSNNISVFSIASTGALTAVGGSPLPATGPSPKGIAVDPLGRYVYVVNSGDNTVSGYARNSTTGLLTPLSPATVPTNGSNSSAITIDPSGKFVYVSNFGTGAAGGGGSVTVFTIDTSFGTAGQLVQVGSPVTTNLAAPYSVAISPSGAYAYVADYGGDTVTVFDINASTGALAFKSLAIQVQGLTAPTSVAAEPNGKYAYASYLVSSSSCGSSQGTVVAYNVSQSGGTMGSLTPGSTSTLSSSGAGPYSVSADPSGMYVYAVQSVGGIINPFKIGTTGALTPLSTVAAQAGTDGAIFILITK